MMAAIEDSEAKKTLSPKLRLSPRATLIYRPLSQKGGSVPTYFTV
jgi:hypothetical protein